MPSPFMDRCFRMSTRVCFSSMIFSLLSLTSPGLETGQHEIQTKGKLCIEIAVHDHARDLYQADWRLARVTAHDLRESPESVIPSSATRSDRTGLSADNSTIA